MEFGYTIPLQKHLKMKLPASVKTEPLFFCWDIHLLTAQRRKAALAMNRSSRYSILLYGMNTPDWMRLPELIQDEIRGAILREGFSEFEAIRYFALAGPLKISSSNGPNSTARLNWAMGTLLRYTPLLDKRCLSQTAVAHIVNDEVYRAADITEYGTPREFFLAGFWSL